LPIADRATHWAIADCVIAAFLDCGDVAMPHSVNEAIAQSALTQ
jgi:hypothetical protein